jgi:DNA-directed RNA polymerase subunit beta'
MMQIRQIAGMRGLVANPKGEIFQVQLSQTSAKVFQYLSTSFLLTVLVRVLQIQALRTADSGYLTRRLCDVAQDVIIREEDCGTDRGLVLQIGVRKSQATWLSMTMSKLQYSERTLSEDVSVDGKFYFQQVQILVIATLMNSLQPVSMK